MVDSFSALTVQPLTLPFHMTAIIVGENSKWSRFWCGRKLFLMPIQGTWDKQDPHSGSVGAEDFQDVFDKLGVNKSFFFYSLNMILTLDAQVHPSFGRQFTGALKLTGSLSEEPEQAAFKYTFKSYPNLRTLHCENGRVRWKCSPCTMTKTMLSGVDSVCEVHTHAICLKHEAIPLGELLTHKHERIRKFALSHHERQNK